MSFKNGSYNDGTEGTPDYTSISDSIFVVMNFNCMGATFLHTCQPADATISLLLEICIKCAWFGAFLPENAISFSKMYGPACNRKWGI